MISSPTPEFKLVLQCLRVRPDPSLMLPIGSAPPDWARFLNICRRGAVRPLVHRALAAAQWIDVPAATHSSLEQFNRQNTLRNTALAGELLKILETFKENDIPAATFKGPALAESLYGSIALREFVDIDIVVRHRDVTRAEQVLAGSGFHTRSRVPHQQDYSAQSGQSSFRRPGERFAVDLHWKLAPLRMSFPFAEEDIWNRLQTVPLAGSRVPFLAWDHIALFAAFHGAKERWRSLKWICDFAWLVSQRTELDWGALLRTSAQAHCSRSLLLAAQLSFDLGLSAPPELLEASRRDPNVQALARRTLQSIYHQTPETDLSIFIYTSQVTERVQDKSKLVLTLLTTLTVSDFESIRLPPKLRALYYLIRPFRILGKATAMLLRRRQMPSARAQNS